MRALRSPYARSRAARRSRWAVVVETDDVEAVSVVLDGTGGATEGWDGSPRGKGWWRWEVCREAGREDDVLCGLVLPGVVLRPAVAELGVEVAGIRSGIGCCKGRTSM